MGCSAASVLFGKSEIYQEPVSVLRHIASIKAVSIFCSQMLSAIEEKHIRNPPIVTVNQNGRHAGWPGCCLVAQPVADEVFITRAITTRSETMPGKTACEMASPTMVIFRSTKKAPRREQAIAIKAATNAMERDGFTNANSELMEDGNLPRFR